MPRKRFSLVAMFLIFLASLGSYPTLACDVCGCSVGGTNLGILPQFHKSFIGLYYSSRTFSSTHPILGTDKKATSEEWFQTAELRGRFYLSKRLQLFAFLPYNSNRQQEDGVTTNLNGLGDALTFVNYNIYNNGDSAGAKWKHNLQVGGGVKLPTGAFKKLDGNGVLNPNIQPGTGSTDLLLDAIYTVRLGKLGLNNNAIYRFNTTNANDFKFGNRVTLASSFFYWANIKGYSLLPSAGLTYDWAASDVHEGYAVANSGGNTLLTNYGLDFYRHSITVGVHFQLPAYQDNPLAQNKLRCGATLLYNF